METLETKRSATDRQPAQERGLEGSPNAALAGFLLNMALLGVQTKQYAAAWMILELLIELSPRLPVTRLLKAHLLFRVSTMFEGRHELLRLIAEHPDYHVAVAMLAMEDREAGVDGWRGLAESVETDSLDPTSRQIISFVLRP